MLHLYWPVYYRYVTCWSIIYTQQVILYWPVCYKYVLTEVLYILSRSYCTHLSVTGMCLLKYYIYSAGHTVLYCNYCYRYVLAEVLYILSRSCYIYTDLSVIGMCLLYTQQVMLHLYWPICYRYVLALYSAGHATSILTCLLQVCAYWKWCWRGQNDHGWWPSCCTLPVSSLSLEPSSSDWRCHRPWLLTLKTTGPKQTNPATPADVLPKIRMWLSEHM